LIKLSCPQGGADIIERNDAHYFRCGFVWPASEVTKVFILNKSSSNGALFLNPLHVYFF